MHHGVGGESLLAQTLGVLDEGAHTVDVVAHLIHARAEHGAAYLGHVVIAVDDGVDGDGVAVGDGER